MADRPGSYRSRGSVSRRTMVMRKARDDDARRIAERDGADALSPPKSGQTNISARLTARGANTQIIDRQTSERTGSGRRVVVHHEGGISGRFSTRLTGQQATSVRVAGGDTIIRLKSGDMVIRRGVRQAELRKQVLVTYILGYFILFGCYAYFLMTGVATITPEAFVNKAFALRHSADIIDLERAAMDAMRGNRTPAEIHIAENLSFHDENRDTVRVGKGDRLTLLTAAKLGHAILEDQKLEESKRNFTKPFRVYKESYLATVRWPYWLTMYNALGFFLLLGLFVWQPLMHYLGTQGKKTAVALGNSRAAQEEAADYRGKYRALVGEMEAKADEMRAEIQIGAESERGQALAAARRQVEEIAGGIKGALRDEVRELSARIGARAAVEACDQARRILEERLGREEHDAAVDDLIADIAGMDFRKKAGT